MPQRFAATAGAIALALWSPSMLAAPITPAPPIRRHRRDRLLRCFLGARDGEGRVGFLVIKGTRPFLPVQGRE